MEGEKAIISHFCAQICKKFGDKICLCFCYRDDITLSGNELNLIHLGLFNHTLESEELGIRMDIEYGYDNKQCKIRLKGIEQSSCFVINEEELKIIDDYTAAMEYFLELFVNLIFFVELKKVMRREEICDIIYSN